MSMQDEIVDINFDGDSMQRQYMVFNCAGANFVIVQLDNTSQPIHVQYIPYHNTLHMQLTRPSQIII